MQRHGSSSRRGRWGRLLQIELKVLRDWTVQIYDIHNINVVSDKMVDQVALLYQKHRGMNYNLYAFTEVP